MRVSPPHGITTAWGRPALPSLIVAGPHFTRTVSGVVPTTRPLTKMRCPGCEWSVRTSPTSSRIVALGATAGAARGAACGDGADGGGGGSRLDEGAGERAGAGAGARVERCERGADPTIPTTGASTSSARILRATGRRVFGCALGWVLGRVFVTGGGVRISIALGSGSGGGGASMMITLGIDALGKVTSGIVFANRRGTSGSLRFHFGAGRHCVVGGSSSKTSTGCGRRPFDCQGVVGASSSVQLLRNHGCESGVVGASSSSKRILTKPAGVHAMCRHRRRSRFSYRRRRAPERNARLHWRTRAHVVSPLTMRR